MIKLEEKGCIHNSFRLPFSPRKSPRPRMGRGRNVRWTIFRSLCLVLWSEWVSSRPETWQRRQVDTSSDLNPQLSLSSASPDLGGDGDRS